MYRKLLLGIAVLFIIFTSSSYATLDEESVLWIPSLIHGITPVIDGEMDPVWYSVTNTFINKNLDECDPPDDWFDNWGQFKLLYDHNNLYAFITIHDDLINSIAPNTYEQDGIELYFDGNNSKVEGAYDGEDDIQLRFNTQWIYSSEVEYAYGNAGADWGFNNSGMQYAFKFTEIGYNLELSISLATIKIEGELGWELGFEIQINDNDEGQRESAKRWWSSSKNTWFDASLFGNTIFDDYYVEERLRIPKLIYTPIIDGILDEAWDICPYFSSNTYVTQTANIPDDWNIYERVGEWNDMSFDFRVMWDYEYLYFFANVYDDVISTEAGEDWEKDGIELYFDGDNSKNNYTHDGIGYDENDKHFSQLFSETPTNDCACQKTDTGWTMEWRIHYTELGWTPQQDLEIGFDVQLNDQDDPALLRSGMARWWGNDNNSRLDASMFGTAVLFYPFGDPDCEFFYAQTFEPTNVTDTLACLNGYVNTNGCSSTVKFFYGTTLTLEHHVFAENSPIACNLGELVFVELSDLIPNTKYYYQLVLFNNECCSYGSIKSFTTNPNLAVVNSLSASDIMSTTAVLNGEVNAKGITTQVKFQYGQWINYGNEVRVDNSSVADTLLTTVSAQITDLEPNTTYHYRVITTSSAGSAYGRDMTFTTANETNVTPDLPTPQQFTLQQNFPNPANPVTNIVYELPAGSHVKITVFNLKGELVRTLYTGEQGPGRYPLLWDGADDSGNPVSSGLYFLRMDADGFMDMKKMMLIK